MATWLWIIGIVAVVWPVLVAMFIDKSATDNVNELGSEVKAGLGVVETSLSELRAEIETLRKNDYINESLS